MPLLKINRLEQHRDVLFLVACRSSQLQHCWLLLRVLFRGRCFAMYIKWLGRWIDAMRSGSGCGGLIDRNAYISV